MEISRAEFLDIGNGWFFAFDEDWTTSSGHCPLGFVGDSMSPIPDVRFGPAAWRRKVGPLSAQILIEVGDPPGGWDIAARPSPGLVRVSAAGREAGFGNLEGRIVPDLATLLLHPSFGGGRRSLAVASAESRLAAVRDDGVCI
jgi:hypothetical protein